MSRAPDCICCSMAASLPSWPEWKTVSAQAAVGGGLQVLADLQRGAVPGVAGRGEDAEAELLGLGKGQRGGGERQGARRRR